jgi:hypothetical protein
MPSRIATKPCIRVYTTSVSRYIGHKFQWRLTQWCEQDKPDAIGRNSLF